MSQVTVTKKDIIAELHTLPPDAYPELRVFMEYLRFKRNRLVDHTDQTQQDRWHTVLTDTFGIWADRNDIAGGVAYVQNIRRGHRLNDLLGPVDESD